jgi:hypothetical protein
MEEICVGVNDCGAAVFTGCRVQQAYPFQQRVTLLTF